MVPAVAAVGSWLESLKLPLREMYRKYTKSELSIMAWRSGEVASNMHSAHETGRSEAATSALRSAMTLSQGEGDAKIAAFEERLGPELVAKLEGNEDVDLRKLTGPEAFRFMRAQGIPIVVGLTRQTYGGDDDISRTVREAHKNWGKK